MAKDNTEDDRDRALMHGLRAYSGSPGVLQPITNTGRIAVGGQKRGADGFPKVLLTAYADKEHLIELQLSEEQVDAVIRRLQRAKSWFLKGERE